MRHSKFGLLEICKFEVQAVGFYVKNLSKNE